MIRNRCTIIALQIFVFILFYAKELTYGIVSYGTVHFVEN